MMTDDPLTAYMNDCFDHLEVEIRRYREACQRVGSNFVFFYFVYNSFLKECEDYQFIVDNVFPDPNENENVTFFKELNRMFKSDDLEWAKNQRVLQHLFTGRIIFPVPQGENAERVLLDRAREVLEGKLRDLLERELDIGGEHLDILDQKESGLKELYSSPRQGISR